jgi:hypothetical protein
VLYVPGAQLTHVIAVSAYEPCRHCEYDT